MKKRILLVLISIECLLAGTACQKLPERNLPQEQTRIWETIPQETEMATIHSSDETVTAPTFRVYSYTKFETATRGDDLTVTLSGCLPGEQAVLRVKTVTGWSNAKGLGIGTADQNGNITWSWRISGSAKTGSGPEVYLMSENGQLIASFPFTILEKETEDKTQTVTDAETAGDIQTDPSPEIETETTFKPGGETFENQTQQETTEAGIQYFTVRLNGGIELTIFQEVERGQKVTVRLTGAAPGETFLCKMICKSGESSAAGLGSANANTSGVVEWTWRISSRTSTTFQPTVTIENSRGTEVYSFQFTVLP